MSSETIETGSLYFNSENASLVADKSGLKRLADAVHEALESGTSNININGSDVKSVVLVGDRTEAVENRVSVLKKGLLMLIQAFIFVWFVVLPLVAIALMIEIYNNDKWPIPTDCGSFYIQGLLKQYGY